MKHDLDLAIRNIFQFLSALLILLVEFLSLLVPPKLCYQALERLVPLNNVEHPKTI